MAKRRWNLSEQHPLEASSWGWGFFPVLDLTKPIREKAILCNDASLGEVTTDFSVHLLWCLKSPLLWCLLTLSALLWCWWFSWYVCTSTLNLIKLWTKIWKSYGWICLHFNAGPHQTLGFYMEILWLDNYPNKLNFLIFGFQLLKFSNKFRWLWKDVCHLKIASAVTLRFTLSLDVQ